MSSPPTKKQRSEPPKYTLLYHPKFPGRGEFVRLCFEATSTPYKDLANSEKNGYETVQSYMSADATSLDDGNPPILAVPALKIEEAGESPLVIHQTLNIMQYLSERLGLEPSGNDKYFATQIAATALDLTNEVHDTHHPIDLMDYYDNQKDESLKKAKAFRETRLPKFLGYFDRALQWNHEKGKGKSFVGDKLSIADLAVWQVLDGTTFAFPEEVKALRKDGKFRQVWVFFDSMQNDSALADYIKSDRKLKYGNSVFRYYPELDRQK